MVSPDFYSGFLRVPRFLPDFWDDAGLVCLNEGDNLHGPPATWAAERAWSPARTDAIAGSAATRGENR